jgi:hypothetical protein
MLSGLVWQQKRIGRRSVLSEMPQYHQSVPVCAACPACLSRMSPNSSVASSRMRAVIPWLHCVEKRGEDFDHHLQESQGRASRVTHVWMSIFPAPLARRASPTLYGPATIAIASTDQTENCGFPAADSCF